MAMNMNNLKIFINVADAGNLTRAAEAMHISQPAVSKAIKSIEEDLGVALFYRDKKNGISLTDTGDRILDYARQMMLTEEKIYQTAYLSKNLLEGTLRIASLPSGVTFFLAEALVEFQRRHPQVNVEILEGSTNEVNRMVAGHAAEFGVSIVPARDFQSKALMEDHIVAISKEPLDMPYIDLALMRQRFFVCRAALESIMPVLEQKRINGRQNFKVSTAQTVRRLVECGLGIGLQAESLLRDESSHLYKYPVKPLVRTDLVLIANSFDELSPAARAFVNTMGSLGIS